MGSRLALVHLSASDSPSPWFVGRLSRSRKLPDRTLRGVRNTIATQSRYVWQARPLRHMHIVFCPNH